METFKIGQLARKAGVNIQTIRYYERRGLLAPAARRESGYREFAPGDVERLRFIKRAQALGFTLEEIAELLDLRIEGVDPCVDVKDRTQSKLQEVDTKIRQLRRIRKALAELVSACEAQSPTIDCPILSAFSDE